MLKNSRFPFNKKHLLISRKIFHSAESIIFLPLLHQAHFNPMKNALYRLEEYFQFQNLF